MTHFLECSRSLVITKYIRVGAMSSNFSHVFYCWFFPVCFNLSLKCCTLSPLFVLLFVLADIN